LVGAGSDGDGTARAHEAWCFAMMRLHPRVRGTGDLEVSYQCRGGVRITVLDEEVSSQGQPAPRNGNPALSAPPRVPAQGPGGPSGLRDLRACLHLTQVRPVQFRGRPSRFHVQAFLYICLRCLAIRMSGGLRAHVPSPNESTPVPFVVSAGAVRPAQPAQWSCVRLQGIDAGALHPLQVRVWWTGKAGSTAGVPIRRWVKSLYRPPSAPACPPNHACTSTPVQQMGPRTGRLGPQPSLACTALLESGRPYVNMAVRLRCWRPLLLVDLMPCC
jgi:hypothetical protein